MTKRRLKSSVVYGVYALGVIGLIGTIYLIEGAISKDNFESDSSSLDTSEVTDVIDIPSQEQTTPVVMETSVLKYPYDPTKDIKILKKYYNVDGTKEEQENALIVYENTYMQSSGICYAGPFDVLAAMDGTVTNVEDSELIGKTVEITHENNVVTLYQSLGETNVAKGDKVTAGTKIGTTGTNNVEKDLNEHLHFELIINGNTVNPEQYFDKTISQQD